MPTMEEMIYSNLMNSARGIVVEAPPEPVMSRLMEKRGNKRQRNSSREAAVPDDVSSSASFTFPSKQVSGGVQDQGSANLSSANLSSANSVGSRIGDWDSYADSQKKKKRRKTTTSLSSEEEQEEQESKAGDDLLLPELNLNHVFDPQEPSDGKMFGPEDRSHIKRPKRSKPTARDKQYKAWCARRIDIRNAVDIGGALEKRVKILVKKNIWNIDEDEEKKKEEKQAKEEESSKDDDDSSSIQTSAKSISTAASDDAKSTMEEEDGDLMQQLLETNDDQKEKDATADQQTTEKGHWEMGLTRPKGYLKLPFTLISARGIQCSPVLNDDRNDILTISPLTIDVPRNGVVSRRNNGALYPFHHNPRAIFISDSFFLTFLTSPQLFLRSLVRRYMGNNASSFKEEQVGHLTCLWRLQYVLDVPFKPTQRLGKIIYNHMRRWQHSTEWRRRNGELGNQLLWFIQNDWRWPGERHRRKRIDFSESFFVPWRNVKARPEYPPHGVYLFIPLTSPPIPQFPLDRTDFTWGGVDRYTNSIHRTNSVPSFFYKLTTSIMLADRNQVKHAHNVEWCKEIMEYETNVLDSMFKWGNKINYERPSYGIACILYHLLAIWDETPNDEKQCEWLTTILEREELTAMSDLHLILSLMEISTVVDDTDAVVEILSRDPREFNPITMFQSIVDDYLPESASTLEYIIHRHTKRTAVERNVTDPIYHSWYIAFLATSLRLCEGAPSFRATRVRLAQAVKLLYDLHSITPSEQTTASLKALEQWEDVWRLLLTGTSTEKDELRPVLLEQRDAFDVAASALETKPASIDSWRGVVNVLGPVTRSEPWDLHDREWWYDNLLKPVELVSFDASRLSSTVLRLKSGSEPDAPDQVSDRKAFLQRQKTDIEWLKVLIEELKDYDMAKVYYDKPADEGTTNHADTDHVLLPELTEPNDALECLAYKVLLIAHFRGVDHPDICSAILVLIDNAWQKTPNTLSVGGLVCLEWLHRMGIDVSEVSERLAARHNQEPVKKKRRLQ